LLAPEGSYAAQLANMRRSAPPRARRLWSSRPGPLRRALAARPRAADGRALARTLGFALVRTLGSALVWALGFALLGALTPGLSQAAAPEFETPDPIESSNGAALLRWDQGQPLGALEYELQEADSPEFVAAELRYRGSFPSYFVSGQRDGTRYFRVRSRSYTEDSPAPWSEWSTPQILVVAHHDLRLALGLFGAGALVFVITCLTLVAGARRSGTAR
jgi:hypothetical protein